MQGDQPHTTLATASGTWKKFCANYNGKHCTLMRAKLLGTVSESPHIDPLSGKLYAAFAPFRRWHSERLSHVLCDSELQGSPPWSQPFSKSFFFLHDWAKELLVVHLRAFQKNVRNMKRKTSLELVVGLEVTAQSLGSTRCYGRPWEMAHNDSCNWVPTTHMGAWLVFSAGVLVLKPL